MKENERVIQSRERQTHNKKRLIVRLTPLFKENYAYLMQEYYSTPSSRLDVIEPGTADELLKYQ